jgi:hypothetical protein
MAKQRQETRERESVCVCVHSPHQTQLENRRKGGSYILHGATSHWLHEIIFLEFAATTFGLD